MRKSVECGSRGIQVWVISHSRAGYILVWGRVYLGPNLRVGMAGVGYPQEWTRLKFVESEGGGGGV
jgi:hypothetical protein